MRFLGRHQQPAHDIIDPADGYLFDTAHPFLRWLLQNQDRGAYYQTEPYNTHEHLRHLLPIARGALAEADVRMAELDAIAATQGPGLPYALVVGLKARQA